MLVIQVNVIHLKVLQGLLALLADISRIASLGTGSVTKNYTKLGAYENLLPEFWIFQNSTEKAFVQALWLGLGNTFMNRMLRYHWRAIALREV
jgi:hypothetical protein